MSLRFTGPSIDLFFDAFEQPTGETDIEIGLWDKIDNSGIAFYATKEEALEIYKWLEDKLI